MRRFLLTLAVLSLLAAACGDDTSPAADSDSSTTTEDPASEPTDTAPEATTTEAEPALTGADLAESGPYPVGVTTRVLPTGNAVEIWYPAGPDAAGQTDTYAVRDFTPEVMSAAVPEEINDRFTVDAGRDATIADDGPHPLVLFSHGSTSFRFQSTHIAHHLASWGIMTASADHPSRSLANLLDREAAHQPSSDDVVAMRALVLADDTLGPAIDSDNIGISGHSAGGGTTLAVAVLDDFAGYVSYASGAFSDTDLPEMPSMFMAGAIDTIVEPDRTSDAFEAAPAPSWFLEFESSGHLAFSDLCAVGDGDGNLIDLADAAGLEAFLTDDLRRLGSDGCEPPNRPVTEVWPGINQATVGFFRWVFGMDPEPLGLDASSVEGVTVVAK